MNIKERLITSAIAMIFMVLAAASTGCANKRFYIGMDDYGTTNHYHSEHDTGNNANRR